MGTKAILITNRPEDSVNSGKVKIGECIVYHTFCTNIARKIWSKQARKDFLPLSAMLGIGYFQNLGIFVDFLGDFWGDF